MDVGGTNVSVDGEIMQGVELVLESLLYRGMTAKWQKMSAAWKPVSCIFDRVLPQALSRTRTHAHTRIRAHTDPSSVCMVLDLEHPSACLPECLSISKITDHISSAYRLISASCRASRRGQKEPSDSPQSGRLLFYRLTNFESGEGPQSVGSLQDEKNPGKWAKPCNLWNPQHFGWLLP